MNIIGWVWNENFLPYMRFLASLTEYEMSDEELWDVEASLEGTSAELGHWRQYTLRGSPEIRMSLAYEVGFDNVQIQFDSNEEVGMRAEAVMEIMMRYTLKEKRTEQETTTAPARE